MPGTGPDCDRLLELIGDIYETAIDPAAIPKALDGLAQALQAAGTHLFSCRRSSAEVFESHVHGALPDQGNDEFVSYYGSIDPRRAALMRLPAGSVMRCHRYFDEKFVAGNEFYQDFLIAHGFRWAIGVHFEDGSGNSTVLACLRALGTPAYQDWTETTLRRLAPHFRRAGMLRARLEGQAAAALDADGLLRALPLGCLLLDRRGRCLSLNDAGKSALADLRAKLVGGFVRLPDLNDQLRWQRGLHSVAGSQLAETLDLKETQGGSAWKLHLIPCRALARTRDPVEQGLVLVVLERTQAARDERLATIKQRYRLTSAELSVLSMLLDGTSPSQIAAERGAQISTVRSQIRSLFDKTNCHSQRQLVAAFAG